LEHGFTCGTVVREHPHFDQAVGIQGGIGFFFNGGGQAVAANHHHGVKVVGISPVDFALGWGQ
jgi:ascorbate-specific PTS system EIIC-type component UlaA